MFLEIKDLSVKIENKNILKNLNLNINKGEVHAIMGPNGSGKSTFLKVVRGLYSPDQGRVLIDGADISQFSQDVLAYWVGFLPQETSLFSGSIRDNIAITQPGVTDPSVIEAAKMAEAHDFILDMPDGYATMLTESGGNLSKGQRQRLALARAFLNNPPIMLLDEPTSNLDENAEKNLAANLKIASQQSTVLAVTHSEEILSVCDSILVMEKGRIVMAGPAKQVLDRLKS